MRLYFTDKAPYLIPSLDRSTTRTMGRGGRVRYLSNFLYNLAAILAARWCKGGATEANQWQ
jgi:hypothetical protein